VETSRVSERTARELARDRIRRGELLNDVLLVVDVVNTFDHEDGTALLASFRARLPAMVDTLEQARKDELLPVVYVNDAFGDWRGERLSFVQRAIDSGAGGDVVAALGPAPTEAFLFKPRYSAFDQTPLGPLLEDLAIERVILIGAATEGCVVQTAIDGRELRLKVTIVKTACATADGALEKVALAYAAEVGGVRLASTLGEARGER
jgi:nicotinamidase-related amidase